MVDNIDKREIENPLIKGSKISISYRTNTDDEMIYKQIFIDGELDLRKTRFWNDIESKYYKKNCTAFIVDCGSHIGMSTIFLAFLFPNAKIVGLEPDSKNFVLASKNNMWNRNATILNAAISLNTGPLYLEDVGIGNAGYRVSEFSENNKSEPVEALSIPHIIERFTDYQPFIIKLDIEGAEKNLFDENLDWLTKFDYILIELHDWLFPREGISKGFWDAIGNLNFDIEALGEHIIIQTKSSGVLERRNLADTLNKIYESMSSMAGWYAELETKRKVRSCQLEKEYFKNLANKAEAEKQYLVDRMIEVELEKKFLENRANETEKALHATWSSFSWMITKPLRVYKRIKPKVAKGNIARYDEAEKTLKIKTFPFQDRPDEGKRILIITPDLVGPIRNGGIGTANSALAIRLAARGYRVDILYTLGNYCEGNEKISSWVDQYSRAGVRLIPLAESTGKITIDGPFYRIRAWYVFQWARKHSGDYDLCIAPEWRGELYYLMLARDTGVFTPDWPIIVVTHSPTQWASEGNYRLPQALDMLDLDFMERQVVARADVLVCPSSYLLEWERSRHWILPDKPVVIPNLLQEFIVTNRLVSAKTITEVVFFGRLETRKGLNIFLQALSRIPVSELELIKQVTFLGKRLPSNESDDLDSRIEKALGATGIPHKIIDDRDSHGAITYLQGEGRIAVIASLMENSPYTVWECLHHGIPFVASQVGGIPELIAPDDRDAVLFKPNPGALARKLTNILKNGTRMAKPIYSLDVVENQWLELIESTQRITMPILSKHPLVSVCLVHYERPMLLAQAVESLRQQNYSNYEVILVDDGSQSTESKRYLSILEHEFRERGWRVVYQDNAYLGSARNHAARLARGEWLLFMDDDNIAKNHEISTFVHAAEMSGADILTCFADLFTEANPPEESKMLWVPLGGDRGGGLFRNVYGDANALVRKSIFESVGGFTEDYGVGHEDWEFFQKAVQNGCQLILVPEALFWYRVQKNGMLRAGDTIRDHVRSARAALLTPGIGTALGYALNAHLRQQIVHDGSIGSKRSASIREAYHLFRTKRHQFWNIKKQYGWTVAIGKALDVLSRR